MNRLIKISLSFLMLLIFAGQVANLFEVRSLRYVIEAAIERLEQISQLTSEFIDSKDRVHVVRSFQRENESVQEFIDRHKSELKDFEKEFE